MSLLEQLVGQSKDLYSLPAVAIKVLELTSNPLVDAASLKASIGCDPALTTKILRVVNSSLFGLSGRVSDLNQALALLGIKPLKLLVLGFSLPDSLFANVAEEILGRYWRETLTRAVTARELAEQAWKIPGDEAFIAGLLKDLGMLVLIQGLGTPYLNVVRRIREQGGDLRAVERHAIGFDRTQLTARLLEQWGLPDTLVAAVSADHDLVAPRDASHSDSVLPRIVHLAELISDLVCQEKIHLLGEVLRSSRGLHAIEPDQLRGLVEVVQVRVAQLADVLSLNIGSAQDYRAVLDAAHHMLSHVAAQAAGDLLKSAHACQPAPAAHDVAQLAAAAEDFHYTRAARRADESHQAAQVQPAAVGQPAIGRHALKTAVARATPPQPNTDRKLAEPALARALRAAVASSRQTRQPLSLLLVEIDQFDRDAIPYEADQWCEVLEQASRAMASEGATLEAPRDGKLALVLPDCDRSAAIHIAHALSQAMRDRLESGEEYAFTVSIGLATVALVSRNFRQQDLVDAAERCLSGAQLSGGANVKSIEIY